MTLQWHRNGITLRRDKLNSQFIVTKFFYFACGRVVIIQISDWLSGARSLCLISLSHRPCPPIRLLEVEVRGWAPEHCISTVLYLKSENFGESENHAGDDDKL